ncbi:MAG: Mov34/MPN/PAD-1 family protein [Candidatus Baldrarchaeia archaeon]
MKVKVSPIVLIKIIDAASQKLDREVGGFLIGKVSDNCLNIVDAEFPESKGSESYVEIDSLAMAAVVEKLEKKGMEKSIVGWWHSHPGFGANFMSSIDVNTQKIYQSLFDKAVALVVDPVPYVSSEDVKKLDLKMYRIVGESYEEVDWSFAVDDYWKIIGDVLKIISEARKQVLVTDSSARKLLDVLELEKELSVLKESVRNLSEIRNRFAKFQTEAKNFLAYLTLVTLMYFVFILMFLISMF